MVTHHIRESLLVANFALLVLVPGALAFIASQAHRLAPLTFSLALAPIAPLSATSEAREASSASADYLSATQADYQRARSRDVQDARAMEQARALFAEAARLDAQAQAVTAYFARYSAHATRALRSGESCFGAIELRRQAVAILAARVAGEVQS